MGNNGLADKIQRKINLPRPLLSVDINDPCVKRVAKEYDSLADRFIRLQKKVKKAFVAAVDNQPASYVTTNLDEIQDFLKRKCGLPRLPPCATTINAVFDRLEEHCSILHIEALQFLIEEIISDLCGPNPKQEIEKFKKSVDEFKYSANMVDLVTRVYAKCPDITVDENRTVKLKVKEFWIKFTMKQFEIIVQEILQTLYEFVSCISVTKGCLCINWIISDDFNSTKLPKKLPLELVRTIGVIYLRIGKDMFYSFEEGAGCETIEAAMIQAIELKNTQAIELLLAVGCNPDVLSTYGKSNVPITSTVNIEETPDEDVTSYVRDKAKKEGLSVIEYTKFAVGSHGGVIDYTPYLERAIAQGTVTIRLSSIGLFGAAGTGKTSTARLLTDQEPVYDHDSTPVMKPEEYYKAIEDTGGTSDADEDYDYNSDDEEPAPKPRKRVQQYIRAAKQPVMLFAKGGEMNEWMPVNQSVLIERFGSCVATLAAQQQAGTTQGTSSIESYTFIEGFSMDTTKAKVQPISSVSSCKASASVTHHMHTASASTQQNDPIACVSNITRNIIDFVKSNKDLQKLGITHFVSMCDTGGMAAFLDIAPAMLSFYSVNLVFLKLNERLDDPAKFFYSVKGQTVGHEYRQITTRSLVRSMVSCKSKVMPSRIKGILTKGSQKPMFMILGTHLDEYKKMEASGECLQSKKEMNAILERDLSDFKDCIHQRKNKMMYTLNTMARDPQTKKLASIIREKVMESYIEVKLPAYWHIFHLAMLEIKQSNKESYGMISLSVLNSVGAVLAQMPPEEVQAALQYFHNLGISLYYPTVASNVVFTDPQFLFDKISEIFALSQGEGRSRVNPNEFNKLSKYGIFNESILGCICKGFSKIFSQSEFLSLLSYLFIVSKIPSDTGDYFMPSVLAEHPNPCADLLINSSSIEPLLLSWDSVPNGLFTSLTTSIQAAEGVNNIRFTISPHDEQYRNRITLNCPYFGFKLRLIECATFFAVAVLVAPSEKIAKRCVELRRVILSCIGKIRERFHWMPLLAYPKEAFLCKIEQCGISQDDIHFCHLDASCRVISCAKDSSVRAPAHPDLHLVWWEQGYSLDHSNRLTSHNMFNLLQDKSAKWDRIGRAFGASPNDREKLLCNPALNDDQRLETVLNRWLESTPNPTWAKFHKILTDSLQFIDVAERTKMFLELHQ